MTPEAVDRVLQDHAVLRDPFGDPELEAVQVAILLEDVLGITLADDEIDPGSLGSPDAIKTLLARHGVA